MLFEPRAETRHSSPELHDRSPRLSIILVCPRRSFSWWSRDDFQFNYYIPTACLLFCAGFLLLPVSSGLILLKLAHDKNGGVTKR
jgi:hypothetical protein